MYVTKRNGERQLKDQTKIDRQIDWSCEGIEGVTAEKLKSEMRLSLHDGIATADINKAIIVGAAGMISVEAPNWTYVASRMVLQEAYKVVTGGEVNYPHFEDYLSRNITEGTFDGRLVSMFDIKVLGDAIVPARDMDYDYLGALTVVDRYLNKNKDGQLIELPQHWLMRVAMGIAQVEPTQERRTQRALEYYNTYSLRQASPSTPTLFNSGTLMPQLSSCFGTNFPDDTDGIMDTLKTNARFSKMAGGCSAGFSHLRASGSFIKSTKGKAGGPIAYAKMYETTLNGFDQSGKRKGAGVGYCEVWHADIENFLKLHDPGDERQRAHDMFVATWIPDLFMERVARLESWTLFDPAKVPLLLSTHGATFEKHYKEYEAQGLGVKTMDAESLWRFLLTKWVQQAVGWPCFKDEINARYAQPQIINHSNLCTEICLRNDKDTSFVCNLTSVNTSRVAFKYVKTTQRIAWNPELEKRVRTCMRSLDSVITAGITPDPSGRKFQLEDRAVGLGCMGWVEMLYRHGVAYESNEAIYFSNEIWKQITATAIHESHLMAMEYGSYPTFNESTWAEGKIPLDTMRKTRVVEKFGLHLDLQDCPFAPEGWESLRQMVRKGMRNSTLTAIAPTATIANIQGTTACTEVPEGTVSLKENLSGEFKIISPIVTHNPFGLAVKSAFDINHMWTVWAAAARQIWICQAQSTNYWVDPNKREDWADYVDDLVFEAWRCGVKTSYYLHSTSMTVKATSVGVNHPGPADEYVAEDDPDYTGGRVCAINAGPDCESCS
jgi:ribonucleoside-diphosphate reductase alpha chain